MKWKEKTDKTESKRGREGCTVGSEGQRREVLASKQYCTCIKAMCAEIMVSRDLLCVMQHLIRCTGFGKPIFLPNK